jgi:hypothetical protein
MDNERRQDPFGVALGGRETIGHLRGIGYWATWKDFFFFFLFFLFAGTWKDYLPESLESAKMMRCKKESSNKRAFGEKVEDAMAHILANGGLEQGLSPLHSRTSPPSTIVRRSSSTSVKGYTHGSPCPIDETHVSVVDSINCRNSTSLAY